MPTHEPNIRPLIRTIREQRVILDTDWARLYSVPTHRFNEAFKRNRDRFPPEFAFQLTPSEYAGLLEAQRTADFSQNTDTEALSFNSSQIAMSSAKHRGASYLPWAFTEHGTLMAANILRSAQAREMSIFIIRSFLRMREELASNSAILKRLAEIDRTLLIHDSALHDLYQKLLPLLEPPPEPPRRIIGFYPRDRER